MPKKFENGVKPLARPLLAGCPAERSGSAEAKSRRGARNTQVQPTVHKPDLSGVLPAEFAEIKQRLDSFSFTPVVLRVCGVCKVGVRT